jgi:hypothetical protein
MPYGPGTYGKQVGRPSESQKGDSKPLQVAIANQINKKKPAPTNMKKRNVSSY